MKERTVEMFEAASHRLEYAGLKAGDRTLILADTYTHQPLLDAVYAAAIALGADVTVMTFRARQQPFNWELPPIIENAIYNVDFTYSVMSQGWFYNVSSERVRGHMRKTGKKFAMWEGKPQAEGHFLALLPGNEEVIKRSKIIDRLLHDAGMIRVTSNLGTNLIMERGDPKKQLMNTAEGQTNYSPLSLESRMAIAKGEHPPMYEVVSGTLMFQGAYVTKCPGPHGHSSMVREPVRMEIDRGRIISIARDTEHGIFLDDWFRSWEDPAVYYIDHFNIGVDHRIRLENLDNLSVHFNYGGLLLGFGISFSSNRGDLGVFRANGHIEIHLTGATVFFDESPILVDGEFTRSSGLRAHNRRPGTGSAWTEVEGHVLPEQPDFHS